MATAFPPKKAKRTATDPTNGGTVALETPPNTGGGGLDKANRKKTRGTVPSPGVEKTVEAF